LGVWGITKHPAVLLGLDPRYAISYIAHDGFQAFAVLGGVFLCVTGAELDFGQNFNGLAIV